MAARQQIATVLTPVLPRHHAELAAFLREIGENIRRNDQISFNRLSTVHFLRWFVLPPPARNNVGPRARHHLVLSTAFDGPLDAHFRELVREAGPAFHEIYGHCEGYGNPEEHEPSLEEAVAYLRSHRRPSSAEYIGTIGRTLRRIRDERRAYEDLQDFLDGDPRVLSTVPPAEDPSDTAGTPIADVRRGRRPSWTGRDVRTWLQRFVALREDLDHLLVRPPPPPGDALRYAKGLAWLVAGLVPVLVLALAPAIPLGWVRSALVIVLALLVAGLLLGGLVGLPLLGLWYGTLGLARHLEEKEKDEADGGCPRDEAGPLIPLERLQEIEDRRANNQLSHAVDIKEGRARYLLLRWVLFAIRLASRFHYMPRGHLAKLDTIHYANWVVLPDQRRLLFLSNYYGSWDRYLDDFISLASKGMNAIWSNTICFPETEGLLEGGVHERESFKRWTRQRQLDTQTWYSAYPDIPPDAILRNTRVREGLGGACSPQQLRTWLSLL